MTKLCSVCGTENKDEVQFCRACGTAFPGLAAAPTPMADDEPLGAGITCDECGFQNKPGVRYCANCGVSLLGTVNVPRPRTGAAPAAADPYAGLSPPPISYPSFAPVAPYPPAPPPTDPPGYPPAYSHGYDDPLGSPDIPDPEAAIAAREQAAHDAPAEPEAPSFAQPGEPANRTPLIAGIVALAIAAAAGAWWFMGSSSRSSTPATAASAPEVTPPAVVASAPVFAPVEPAPVAASADLAASAPLTGIVPPEIALPASGPFLALPTAAAPLPAVVPPLAGAAASDPAANAEAKRIAAEKRREKVARDKADREAKAKTQADQLAATAAAARAEQEAQAKRRADEAAQQRSRPTPVTPVAPVQAPAQPRGVREICAGRGSIAEAVCQSRECGAAEHFNEAICRQIRDADERRRNYTN